MEKRDNTNPEFEVPENLARLIESKDFGRYANNKGELPTCFIADLDITGGNSGSPVLDANGQMIGIAFDGNWEAMSGDIAYEPELQRTIAVDIRYVLFIVDKVKTSLTN
jgi:S1-C subfamily serine protease